MSLGMRGKIISVLLLVVLPLCAAYKARAAAVPDNFRLYDNYANVSKLVNYDDVQSDGYFSQPQGEVKFSDGNDVPPGYKLWFLDQGEKCDNWDPCTPFYPDRQVIGVVALRLVGFYNFEDQNKYVFGDKWHTTNYDEGAQVGEVGAEKGEEITIIAQAPNDKFYEAHFTSGNLFNWGFIMGEYGKNNIEVEDQNEIPNLSYGFEDLATFVYHWLCNDCQDPIFWAEDPNLYGCERLDADSDGDMDFIDFAHLGRYWDPNE